LDNGLAIGLGRKINLRSLHTIGRTSAWTRLSVGLRGLTMIINYSF